MNTNFFAHTILFCLISFGLYGQNTIKKQDWVKLTGSLTAGYDYYNMSPTTASRYVPNSWQVGGSLNLQIKKFSIPFSLTYGRQKLTPSYPNLNQFQMFGASPKWKWITLHGGYRNLTFSQYTLAGHTFLGGGVELNPGIIRLGFIYGRFQDPIARDVSNNPGIAKYKRMGWAAKVGLGKEKNYADLILFHAKDDSTSLPSTFKTFDVKPGENYVIGTKFHFTLSKKLTWDTDGGISIYTRDLYSPTIPDSVINKEDEPIPSLYKISQKYLPDIKPLTSMRANSAVRTQINYKAKLWNLKAGYERIDPNYATMGAYFFANDIENITAGLGFHTKKNQVTFNATGGKQRNNLLNNRSEQTNRWIGNANLAIAPAPNWGVNINYSNFSFNQQASFRPLNDSNRIASATQNLSIVPRYTKIGKKLVHNFILVTNLQKLDDLNRFSAISGDMNAVVAQFSHNLTALKSGMSLGWGINYNDISVANTRTQAQGVNFTYAQGLLKNQLNVSTNLNLNHNRLNGKGDGLTLNLNVNAGYSVGKHSFNAYFMQLNQQPLIGERFRELRAGLNYVFAFGS